jgi:hypothetical protein
MKNYTAYCKDESGNIEEIDFKSENIVDARKKAKQIIKEEYCNSLKVFKIVHQHGTWV